MAFGWKSLLIRQKIYYFSSWWRFVIHGAIEGYSLVVLMNCSANNFAQTVLTLIVKAVSVWITCQDLLWPRGGEFNVAIFMLTHPLWESAINPVIVGKSVHNQKIERLWRDLFQGVSCTYYYLFYHLEEIGLLSPFNRNDLFCLHYNYLNVINHHLEELVNAWKMKK